MNISTLLFGPIGGFPGILIIILVVWELVWKGMALWKSARNGQKKWFFFLFILSTVGILPVIYISFFQKRGSVTSSE